MAPKLIIAPNGAISLAGGVNRGLEVRAELLKGVISATSAILERNKVERRSQRKDIDPKILPLVLIDVILANAEIRTAKHL